MGKARRILSGGWLSTAVSNFTRGFYTESGTPILLDAPPVVDLSVLFRIRHELDLSEWTDTSGSGISRVGSGLAGTNGKLRVNITDTSARICTRTLTFTSDFLRYRLYFDIASLTMASGDRFVIHQIRSGSDTLYQLELSYDGSSYSLIPTVYEDGGSPTEGDAITITKATHWAEVELRRNYATPPIMGAAVTYVDNEQSSVLLDLDIDTLWDNISAFRLGAISGLDAGTSGDLHFDEIIVTDGDNPIGPHTFNRLELNAFDYRVQFFVGPHRDFVDAENIAFGYGYDVSAETTLTADMDEDSDSAQVASTADFRSAGGAYIEAHAADEVDEFVTYDSKTSTTLDDLTRDLLGENQSGVHTTGAAVKQWIEVTERITGLDLNWQRAGNVVSWSATLRGLNYNSSLFRRDNTIMAKVSFYPDSEGGNWTSPVVLFFGHIAGKNVDDDYRQGREFTLKVEGVQEYLSASDVDAKRFGRNNLAENRPVTASSTLQDVLLEAESGEFTGAPSVEAGNVVDGNKSTLWISHSVPDVTVESKGSLGSFDVKIVEVYPRHLVGSEHWKYQWFEILIGNQRIDTKYQLSYILTSQSGWPGWRFFRHGGPAMEPGKSWIFCANRRKFDEAFAIGKYAQIIDCNRQLFPLAGSLLHLVKSFTWSQHGNHGEHSSDLVGWGSGFYNYSWPDDKQWTGGWVSLPDYGHSIRRTPTMSTDTHTAADWTEEEYPLPGRHASPTSEWVSVELPIMTATLSAELTAGYTAYAELTNLDGLTESGRVQLDLEWIDYTSLDRENDRIVGLTRGVGGTSDVTHNAGTTVYQVEDDVATNHLRINNVAWRRRVVYDGSTLVVPEDFSIWYSNEASPDYPETGYPGSDWARICIAHGWDDPEFVHHFSVVRARHVMLFIREMSNSGRAKVNEFEVYEAGVTIDGVTDTAAIFDVGGVVEYILTELVGMDGDKVTIEDDTAPFLSLTTGKANALNLLDDLGQKTNCVLVCELDGSVTWESDPRYPLYTLPQIAVEFGRGTLIRAAPTWGHGIRASQVIVNARDGVSGQQFTGYYPPEAGPTGSPQVVEDVMLGSSQQAQRLAEMRYKYIQGALQMLLEAKGTGEDPLNELPLLRPGSLVTLTWNLDQIGDQFDHKPFIIMATHLSADFGKPDGQRMWDVSFQTGEFLY